jgi:hypothetical protein
MARESQDARDARAARYSLGVQQEVTAEMRCAVRDAITALDAVIVGESIPQRDARVRGLLEAALAVTNDTVVARRVALAAAGEP